MITVIETQFIPQMKENIPFKSLEELDLHAEQCLSKSKPKTMQYHHYYELADLYFKMGAFSKALSYLDLLMRKGTSSIHVLSLYGDCVSLLGRSNETIDVSVAVNKSVLSDMNSSFGDADRFYDARQSPPANSVSNINDSISLEAAILDKLRAIEIGDEKLDSLDDIDKKAANLERDLGSNITTILYLVRSSFLYINRSDPKKALTYCSRLLNQIRNGRHLILDEYLLEAKLNLALCILFGLLLLDEIRLVKFMWVVDFINKYLQRPFNRKLFDKNNLWSRFAMERFLFTNLWNAHMQNKCKSLLNVHPKCDNVDNLFDSCTISKYKPLFDFLAEMKDADSIAIIDTNSSTIHILAAYICQFPIQLKNIIWFVYCFWSNADSQPKDLSCLLTGNDNWLDIYTMIFGLLSMCEDISKYWWTFQNQNTLCFVLAPFYCMHDLVIDNRYTSSWWLLNKKRLYDRNDIDRYNSIRDILALKDSLSIDAEIIHPKAILQIAFYLTRLARSLDEPNKCLAYDRAEMYLCKITCGYFEDCHTMNCRKMWFSCNDFSDDYNIAKLRGKAEIDLASLLEERGNILKAIDVLCKSRYRNFDRDFKLLQLYLHDKDTYKSDAIKLCRKLLNAVGVEEIDSRYNILRDISDKLDDEVEENGQTALLPMRLTALIDTANLLTDITQLKDVILHMIKYTVPMLEQYCSKKSMLSEYVNILNNEIEQCRSMVNTQQKSLMQWNYSIQKEGDDEKMISNAVTVTERTISELNNLMKCLTI